MKFSLFAIVAAAATLVAAHPSVEAINEVQVRDTNTHVSEFDTRHNLHRRKRIVHKNTKVTFYWGSQLNNPACGGPTPNENEPVAAVKLSMGWAKCGDTLHVHWKGKMISVKVVDDCGSCNSGKPWVDLARGMFKKIEDLDVGELHNAHVRVIHNN